MCADSDFEILEDIMKEENPEPTLPEENHPQIVKNSWTAQHSKFTRRISNTKNIFQEVQGLGLHEDVIEAANQIYQHVCSKKKVSGKRRRAVVCTCIYYAHNQIEPNGLSYDEAIRIFKLDNKVALKGFKFVNSFNNCASTCFTANPETYIKMFLKKLGVSADKIKEVLDLYDENSVRVVFQSRPRPQSLAAAYIYYWLKNKHEDKIDINHLTVLTTVSQLTIEKFERDIRTKIDLIEAGPTEEQNVENQA
jgi:transcription initiation factor TFIIIB Brf1 subunit/transcription initiation factor TFIIB